MVSILNCVFLHLGFRTKPSMSVKIIELLLGSSVSKLVSLAVDLEEEQCIFCQKNILPMREKSAHFIVQDVSH